MMNEIIQSLFDRKSVRAFTDEAVSKEIKDLLVNSALQAPTAGNQAMYTIIDVTNQELKDTLAKTCDNQAFIAKAPVVYIFLADQTRWVNSFKKAGAMPRKPGVGDLMLSLTDATIAAQNMVVAAQSLGLGSCYIGDILEKCEEHRKLLNLPMHVVPVCMLVMGYPEEKQKTRTKPARISANFLLGENTYPTLSDSQLEEWYQDRAEKENRKTIQPYNDYMQAFCKRKYNSAFSEEMTRSVLMYLKAFEE